MNNTYTDIYQKLWANIMSRHTEFLQSQALQISKHDDDLEEKGQALDEIANNASFAIERYDRLEETMFEMNHTQSDLDQLLSRFETLIHVHEKPEYLEKEAEVLQEMLADIDENLNAAISDTLKLVKSFQSDFDLARLVDVVTDHEGNMKTIDEQFLLNQIQFLGTLKTNLDVEFYEGLD